MPREYYTNMLALRADIQLIYNLMSIKDPQMISHFKELFIDMSLVVVENFLTIYTNTTCAEIVDVIMDHFLDRGSIVLLKSMILILGYLREHLMGCHSFCKRYLI
jgi:Rab-GTPase-TBC domain